LGVSLIERHAGGLGGGGARLTDVGREYVARFNVFAQGVETLIAHQFDRAFTPEKL
jgi:molybdate transport repressor ModE-like protein